MLNKLTDLVLFLLPAIMGGLAAGTIAYRQQKKYRAAGIDPKASEFYLPNLASIFCFYLILLIETILFRFKYTNIWDYQEQGGNGWQHISSVLGLALTVSLISHLLVWKIWGKQKNLPDPQKEGRADIVSWTATACVTLARLIYLGFRYGNPIQDLLGTLLLSAIVLVTTFYSVLKMRKSQSD